MLRPLRFYFVPLGGNCCDLARVNADGQPSLTALTAAAAWAAHLMPQVRLTRTWSGQAFAERGEPWRSVFAPEALARGRGARLTVSVPRPGPADPQERGAGSPLKAFDLDAESAFATPLTLPAPTLAWLLTP
jgi:hypothetical protein